MASAPPRRSWASSAAKAPKRGQFVEAEGIAVDRGTGDVYLDDKNNQRVDKFTSEGAFLMAWGWGVADGVTQGLQTCTTSCFPGIPGAGAGQFAFASGEGVAVDNDPLSPSFEDIYIEDRSNNRIQKFSPSGAFLAAYGGHVNENGSSICLAGEKCQAGKEGTGPGEFSGMAGGIAVNSSGDVFAGDLKRIQEFNPNGIYVTQIAVAGYAERFAIDSAGDFYVTGEGLNGVRKYNSSGLLLETIDAENTLHSLAFDPAGDLFVEETAAGSGTEHLVEYDSTGKEVARFDPGTERSKGIVFGNGRLYVITKNSVQVVTPPGPEPELAAPETASEIRPTRAVLGAAINPENHETAYRFEYGTTSSYGTSAPVPDGAIGSDFEDHPVSVELSGLSVRTTYHYRVVATNSAGTIDGPDQTFTTLPPTSIDSESALDVASSSATLNAQIDPLGSSTTYRFEYGTSTTYGTSAPVPDAEIGSGTSAVEVSQHLQGLQPATTYHYRVVAQNALGTVEGEDRTFTTQLAVSTAGLPDGRMWEMVSPPDKQGAPLSQAVEGIVQASLDGSALTYLATGPTEEEPAANRALEYMQIFAHRGSRGWVSKNIEPPDVELGGLTPGGGPEYRLFSGDLSKALVERHGGTHPVLAPGASEPTPYLRANFECEVDPALCYEPLGTTTNVLPPRKPKQGEDYFHVQDATPDLSHVVVNAEEPLTPTPVNGLGGLYEWAAGNVQLVTVLPANEGGGGVGGALGSHSDTRHAISGDGSRIVWTSNLGHLYQRDTTKGETVRLDAVEAGAHGGSGTMKFQSASSDGSRVFFTDTAQLTVDSTTSALSTEPDLYEFDTNTSKLTDLTVDLNTGERANVRATVLGTSEDGSYIYFVANGVLAPGAKFGHCGQGGASLDAACNLYVSHNGKASFIAALSNRDAASYMESGKWGEKFDGNLGSVMARVSPDGRWFAFRSDRSLTGYDNRDALSGEPDPQMFLYDASANRVVCASCDPTGARPTGAASVPGYERVTLTSARYQPNYLSDSGRLFFDSADALVPRDTNGTQDVYQYEPQGVGSCEQGIVSFNEASNGCVGLISSGGSAEESTFLDASANGNDVFFLTAAGLAPQDYDGALDVYDARACTASSPCLPVAPVSPPPCTTGDSCKPAPSLQPASFGAPSSETFSGAGNVSAGSDTGVKQRSLTVAQKLANALKVCRKKHAKHKRAVCERQARHRYAKASRVSKASVNKSLSGRAGR